MKRVGVFISLLIAWSLAFAVPVLAAAPSNDTFGGATVIGSLPFTDTLDTTEATTDATDQEANADCGAPATDASVWYTVTASSDDGLAVDVSQSDYSAGVIVVTGSPGSFTFVTCGPGAVEFPTVNGETYSIVAFDDQQDGAGNGGTLVINVDVVPPPPVVALTVDPTGRFNSKTGTATITGTVTCTGGADFTEIDVSLRQSVGRFVITGSGFTDFPCDGSTHGWSAEVFPDNGVFKGGHTASVSVGTACGPFECGEDFQEHIVKLRR
jgi:hypothetical protein